MPDFFALERVIYDWFVSETQGEPKPQGGDDDE